ncbi:hypothetical protein BO70DRAFT_309759, partial [Aspergillus heteromorphus CBS 117.55]
MFRKPRMESPDPVADEAGRALHPLPVVAWGPLALAFLGVPIVVGIHMFVVQDEDYRSAIQKLHDAGFRQTKPNRAPAPEILNRLPNPENVIARINAGYKRLDHFSTTFDYPTQSHDRAEQLFLIRNSLFRLHVATARDERAFVPTDYYAFDNVLYPRERTLIEGLVNAAMDDESLHPKGYVKISSWGQLCRAWIAQMVGYLGLTNELLDHCVEERAITWYSENFGRVYEEKNGPVNRRISKRVGSGKEMPCGMDG